MTAISSSLSARTAAFLGASRERIAVPRTSPHAANWQRAFFEQFQDEPLHLRQAKAFAYSLVNEPVCLLPDGRLVGHIYQAVPGAQAPDSGGWGGRCAELDAGAVIARRLAAEVPELGRYCLSAESWAGFAGCAPGHIGWHWEWGVQGGIEALLQRLDAAWPTQDERGRQTLAGMRLCVQAVLDWNEQHLAALRQALAAAGDPDQRAAIAAQIGLCEWVPRHGARSFREAVQAFHFLYLATIFENPHGGNGPGRLDYWLWPYLERDLASGAETLDSARELIDELFIRFHERLMHGNDGWVETIVVAGCHPDGSSAFNPLARLMVESITALNLSHPSVYIRLPEHPEPELLRLAAADLAHGGNRAQVLSDPAIVAAMTHGEAMPVEDARMYMCGGCMEVSPQGMNGDLLFSGFINTPKILELVLNGGVCLRSGVSVLPDLTRALPDYACFEDLYGAMERELQRLTEATFRLMDITAEAWGRLRPRFLVSAMVQDCMARGRVINAGGARYEDTGSTPLGLPNLADSLYALRRAVFDRDAFISAPELLAALRRDFEGAEPLRRRLLALPKYGQGCEEADAIMQRVVRTVCALYEARTNLLGGRMKLMIMTFRMAPIAGRALGATADGRHSGQPIAQGITPQNVALTKGLTVAVTAHNRLDLHRFRGGASSMYDLDPSIATTEIVTGLLRAFLAGGGQMFQGNMTEVAELERALAKPQDFPHLMVRVGGFSARFVALEPELQRDIISRHRHCQ
jgi:formate C-acetyltransferase